MRGGAEASLSSLLLYLNMYKIETSKEDIWTWNPANNGLFRQKQLTKFFPKLMTKKRAVQKNQPSNHSKTVLHLKTSSNYCLKMFKDSLPTKDDLVKRNIISDNGDSQCSLCEVKDKIAPHLFFPVRLFI